MLLVGWSLGGIYARELARARPERVRAVVTLGSPFSGDPHANNVWRLYEWVAGHKVDDPPIPRNSRQAAGADAGDLVAQATGSSRSSAARGLAEESDQEVEFRCSHMAFGVSRRVADQVVQEIHSFLKKHL